MFDDNFKLIVTKPENVPIVGLIFLLVFFVWYSMREAVLNDRRIAAGRGPVEKEESDRVWVWPDLVYTELISLILCTVVLIVWSILLKAPLEQPANRAVTPNPSKAPWYFLGLQEMLVYYDPWMAGVVLPTMILVGLIAIPYIDYNPKGCGYYTFAQRKFAVFTLNSAIVSTVGIAIPPSSIPAFEFNPSTWNSVPPPSPWRLPKPWTKRPLSVVPDCPVYRIPGINRTNSTGFRPLRGRSTICFCSMMDSRDPFSVWISSAVASTVTLSEISPTWRTGDTRLRSPSVKSVFSTTQVLKPENAAVMEYVPRGSAKISKFPCESETAFFVRLVPRFTAVTSAPATTAPEESVTIPRIDPSVPT
jgi:hypothetical protein